VLLERAAELELGWAEDNAAELLAWLEDELEWAAEDEAALLE
jgi:hypothetical protein